MLLLLMVLLPYIQKPLLEAIKNNSCKKKKSLISCSDILLGQIFSSFHQSHKTQNLVLCKLIMASAAGALKKPMIAKD